MIERRFDVQGLRGLAVISIVLFNFFPSLFPYGFLGVDVFFTISGFLTAKSLEFCSFSLYSLARFYLNRARRIVLLILLTILSCAVASAFLRSHDEITKPALLSSFFIMNLLTRTTREEDYYEFLSKADGLFTHLWSLSVEVQFYIIAPALLLIYKPNNKNRWRSFALLTAVSIASLVHNLSASLQNTFASTPARLWQFLMGAMAFHAHLVFSGKMHVSKREPTATGIIILYEFSLLSTMATVCFGDSELNFRLWTTYSVAFMIANVNFKFLHIPSLQTIGEASYCLYLISWPIACVLARFSLIWNFIGMALSVVLAVIMHRYFEKWCTRLPQKDSLMLIGGMYAVTLTAIGTSAYFGRA
ncbi:hypothetical protein PMAYCL1PPCAC_08266 [Pristionchus mayeri]|uniref:Acyltransferase 3 domain-containing protein n=1 Tax=Pristionchus mayeri TaxID=1317129 RepID=A0AAN4ZC71_9BILA|nr:hypothetical protein PMAYCL1PPCAC_08266 [Pristionchus mayeri]